MKCRSAQLCAYLIAAALLLAACGGGSSNSSMMMQPPTSPPPPPPPPPTLDPQYLASAQSPFAAGCEGIASQGTLFPNAEVEPSLAVNPQNARNLVASWQEDRWSTGGSRGIVVGASSDGGTAWSRLTLPFTRCAGGASANSGDYERASNAWVATAPSGTAYVAALAFTGLALQPGSVSAVVASRSTDGGATWSATATLIRDTDGSFNDKVAITADPVTPHLVYAVWDRLTTTNTGPTWFVRSMDDGASWEAARAIYDPGPNNQTINNILVVLPNGTLIVFFVEIDTAANGSLDLFLTDPLDRQRRNMVEPGESGRRPLGRDTRPGNRPARSRCLDPARDCCRTRRQPLCRLAGRAFQCGRARWHRLDAFRRWRPQLVCARARQRQWRSRRVLAVGERARGWHDRRCVFRFSREYDRSQHAAD